MNRLPAHPNGLGEPFGILPGGAEPGAASTLGQAIRRNAGRFPRRPAMLASGFAPLTYRELQGEIDGLRKKLRQAGHDGAARIGVLMPNGPEAVLAIAAVACCAVSVPLDPRLTAAELDRRLAVLRLRALVVPRGSAGDSRRAAERRGVAIIEAVPAEQGRLTLSVAVPASGSPVPDTEQDPHDPAFILQSSGTTAQPKLIPFTHANMLAAAVRLQAWFGLTPEDRCLSVSSPCYSHGLKVTVFTPLLTGGSIALPANAAAVDLDEWFGALRPTWTSAGPTLHAAVLDKARSLADPRSAHSLRFVVSGGAPLPPEVRDELWRVLGIPVLEHYGSSEAAQIAANQPPPGPNRPGTCGRPWPGTVMIAGEGGHPLPAGEAGEVWVRGPTVTPGYLDAPGLNGTSFVAGWLRTGDIGSLDQDGFLSLHGRLSERINRGGDKIAPAEIDAALMRHPAVAEAAAFAVSHPRLGEDVAAAVVLHPGAQATPEELRRFARGDLAPFKVPRRILVRDELPKGATGKVQRRRLRELADGSARQPPALPAPAGAGGTPDLEAGLLALWRRLLNCETLTVDDDFFANGGDSLLAMEMLLEVERLVGYFVPETVLFGAETIRRLVPRIVAQETSPVAPVFHSHAEDGRPALYFFHGGLDGGLAVRPMVSLFGVDHPIVTIAPHGLRGEKLPSSIEAMAAERLPLILERQASGPFLLGGYCNGALVAFEAARQLTAAGHRVDMVAMIDPPTVNARPAMRTLLRLMCHRASPLRLARVYERLEQAERVLRPGRLLKLRRALRMSRGELLARTHEVLDVLVDTTERLPRASLYQAYTIAMAHYVPAPLDVPVIFYAATHDGRAWRRLSPRLEVIRVPGGHVDCLTLGAELMVGHLRQTISALAGSFSRSS